MNDIEAILTMEVGDELDAAVAREVMEDDLEHRWEEGPSLTGVKYCVRCETYDWMPDASKPCSVVPYSRDILAAWQLKERLNGEGLLLTLIDLCPSGENLCRAEFWDNMGLVPSKMVGGAEAEFAPEAICKASLLTRKSKDVSNQQNRSGEG